MPQSRSAGPLIVATCACVQLGAYRVHVVNKDDELPDPFLRQADRDWGMRTLTLADPGGYTWEITQELPSAPGSS